MQKCPDRACRWPRGPCADRDVSALGYSWELKLPTGVEYVDGVDGARKAVREQVMYGADWIKYYSDRREHFEADGRLRSSVNFTDEEAKAIVEEAHRLGKKVATHAIGSDGIAAALRAGVDTIEHGDGLTDQLMDEMVRRNVYWVPTLTVRSQLPDRRCRRCRIFQEDLRAAEGQLRQGHAKGSEDCSGLRRWWLRLEKIQSG